MLFFIYQQIELDTFLPIAMELKKKIKKNDIKFFITNKDTMNNIYKSSTLSRGLESFGKPFLLSSNKNKLLVFIENLLVKLRIIFWIAKLENKIVFFPTFAQSKENKIINFFFKRLNVKKFLLSQSRMVDEAVGVLKKTRTLKIPKESKNYFDGYIYYHSLQIDFLEQTKKNGLITKDNLVKIGLPGTGKEWQKFLKKEKIKELKELEKKYKKISNIYTVIGVKGFNISKFLKNAAKTSKQFKSLVKEIFSNDPNCLIIYKPHPRDEKPREIFKFFDEKEHPRFVISYLHTDLLAKLSKSFFFLMPNNILTNTYGILKINYTNINKHYSSIMKNTFTEVGFGDIRLNPNSNWKKRLKEIIYNVNLYKRKKYFKNENLLIKKNKFNIKNLVKFISR